MSETKASGKAAPDKGAAARSERKPKAKKLKFKDIELTLAPELPETIIWEFPEIEEAEENDNPIPIFRFLRTLVGAEQYTMLRRANERGDLELKDLLPLIEAILGKYGMTAGESSASQGS